jgi:hypothetical protein
MSYARNGWILVVDRCPRCRASDYLPVVTPR